MGLFSGAGTEDRKKTFLGPKMANFDIDILCFTGNPTHQVRPTPQGSGDVVYLF